MKEGGFEQDHTTDEAFDTLESLLASIQTPEDARARLLYLESKVEEYAVARADIENALYGVTRPQSPLVVAQFEEEREALTAQMIMWEGWYDAVLQLFPKHGWSLHADKADA